MGGAVFVPDVDVFAAFGFGEVMDAFGRYDHKIGLVAARVSGRVSVVLVDYEQYEALLARLGDQSNMTTFNPSTAGSGQDFDNFPVDTGVSIAVEVSVEEARRLVNRTIVPELGTGLGAKEPDLMLRGQQVIWRVPIVLLLSGLGNVGEVGININTPTLLA